MTNELKAVISGRDDALDVVNFSVRQDATPIAPGDSSGSVGDINVTARAIIDGPPANRTGGLVSRKLTITDTVEIEGEALQSRGVVSGDITTTDTVGHQVTFSADSPLVRLRADRKAGPFFGTKREAPLIVSRANLNTNPSWTADITGSLATTNTGAGATTRVVGGGSDGGAYLAWTWTSASSAPGTRLFTAPATVVAERTYTASFYVRYTRAATTETGLLVQRALQSITWYDASATAISTVNGGEFLLTQGEWIRATISGVAPANAVSMRASVVTVAGIGYANPAVNDTLSIDQILVEQAASVNSYFDGGSDGGAWDGAANNSSSTLKIYGPEPTPNYDATQANAFRYYCSLVGINEDQLIIDNSFEGVPVAYPAWEGDVWDKIKQFCTAVGGEVISDADLIYLRPVRRYYIAPESFTPPSISVNRQATAQNLDVWNYNNRWKSDALAWISDTAYSVNTGESQTQTIQLPHSLTSINSPVPAAAVPSPDVYAGGTGVYVVLDSDDNIVSPEWWMRNGGKITASLVNDSFNEVQLVLAGPSVYSDTYKSPFRIGRTATDGAGILLTGSGVFTDKQLVRIPSGAGSDLTSIIVAATVDNPFISDNITAHDRGAIGAGRVGGPSVTLNMTIPSNTPVIPKGGLGGVVSFGSMAGARIVTGEQIFRITSTRSGINGISLTAEADMTFADVEELYSVTFDEANITYQGMSFDVFNALWAPSLTFDGFTALQDSLTFDDINAIFEGMDFNQHAVTPYIEKVITNVYEF